MCVCMSELCALSSRFLFLSIYQPAMVGLFLPHGRRARCVAESRIGNLAFLSRCAPCMTFGKGERATQGGLDEDFFFSFLSMTEDRWSRPLV